jgi:hypothetical protein
MILNILGLLVLIALLFVAIPRVDKYLYIQAIDVCSSTSIYREKFTDRNTEIEQPVEEVFQSCLVRLGY